MAIPQLSMHLRTRNSEAVHEEITILLIEDEAFWAQSLRKNLIDFGFQVAGTPSGFEAAIAALNQNNYDLVLLDIHMNGTPSGLELGSMIATLYKKPFIFLTSETGSDVVRRAVSARPAAYLTKPVQPASLFATIQAALLQFEAGAAAAAPPPGPDACFFVKQGARHKKLFWRDIVGLTAEKNYTGLLNGADHATYFIRSTLPKTLQYIIPADLRANFAQVSRTEAVQLSYILELSGRELRTALRSFDVSEHYLQPLKERLHFLA